MQFPHFKLTASTAAALLAVFAAGATHAAAKIGQPAPDVSVTDATGKPVKVSDFKGKHVVLEWVNPGCPYVMKHYSAQNMQALQKEYGAQNVVWLSVNSTNASHADYLKPAAMSAWMRGQGGSPAHILMDTDGSTGRAYDARTTPHMFVIDPKGTLVFAGGIDSIRSAAAADVPKATNYVRAALTDSLAGKAVATADPAPYGCSVKY